MISGKLGYRKFALSHYDKLIAFVIHPGTVVKHLNNQWCIVIVTARTRPSIIFVSQE